MDYLWSPWRSPYISSGISGDECLFCKKASDPDDRKNYTLLRAERNFVLLNIYPYTTGHLMIAPYEHAPTLEDCDLRTLEEMMRLARKAEASLKTVYRPGGFNVGINIGHCAGAGIPGHLHMHVLPRWSGDINFMTTVADTRVLPENLDTTYEKLAAALKDQ